MQKLKNPKWRGNMIKHSNQHPCDLRKKNSFTDPMNFINYNINFYDCMVILVVFTVLLLSILAVSAAPNPNIMFEQLLKAISIPCSKIT